MFILGKALIFPKSPAWYLHSVRTPHLEKKEFQLSWTWSSHREKENKNNSGSPEELWTRFRLIANHKWHEFYYFYWGSRSMKKWQF